MAAEDVSQGGSDARAQELMAYAEQVRSELNAVEEQRQMMQDVLQDYARGREALKALKAGDAETEILVPLGGGTYAPARIADPRRVLMSLGSNVHAEGDLDAALKRVDAREEQAKQATEQLKTQSQKLVDEMTRLNQELQTLTAGGGGAGHAHEHHHAHEHPGQE